MRNLNFNDFENFAMEVADAYDRVSAKDHLDGVSVIALYDEAKEIIRELVCIGYEIANISLESPEIDNYVDEYMIDILDGTIWVEPAKRNGKYLYSESEVCYVLDNCSSKVLPNVYSDEKYEVSIDIMDNCSDEDKCDPYSCNHKAPCGVFDKVEKDGLKINSKEKIPAVKPGVKVTKDEDGDMHGVSFSRTDANGGFESYSVYSNHELPIEALSRLFPKLFK